MRIRPVLAIMVCAGLAAGCAGSTSEDTQRPASVVDSGSATASIATPATVASPVTAPAAAPEPDTCGAGALLASLSLRNKLAQLLTVGVADAADARQIVESEQIGGIFIGSWTDPRLLAERQVPQIIAGAKLPPMVTIDEEGGRVSRIKDLLGESPSARELAATMTPEQVKQVAYERGQGLKSYGITVDFAPVVDVSAQVADEVIGDRSFSDDPEKVILYAGAYAQGLRDAGIFPVIKHFPGHGSSSGDSHQGAAQVPPLDQLQTKDLIPFRSLATPGVGVMVGHLDVPDLTEPGIPASISPATMALLRNGVGYGAPPFDGPIFTDDLSGMAAITDRFDITEAVRMALAAGADVALWLSTDRVPEVLDYLEASMAAPAPGGLTQPAVDAAVVRVAKAKGALTC